MTEASRTAKDRISRRLVDGLKTNACTAALLLLGACTTPSETEPSGLTIRVVTTSDAPVTELLATVAFADEVQQLNCPAESDEASGRLRCTRDGLEIRGGDRPVTVTVRSRGNAFATTTTESEKGSATLRVAPLAEAEQTPDYATRLDGPECLKQLEELALPFDSDLGSSYSVKFYVRNLRSEPELYFQNTKKHPLHYDFARKVLGVTGTADQFAIDTYTGLDRPALGGTLIFYPSARGRARGASGEIEAPWTLNFFPGDAMTGEQVRLAHRLVEERLTCSSWTGATSRLVYVPATNDREAQAGADDASFARAGISWMSRSELLGGLRFQALNEGVAYGTLQRVTPEELVTRPVSFRDILLLTRLPNELPLVGGSITEELQTPLAHVNVAARSRGTPNLAYPEAAKDPQIAPLIGQLVRFEVADGAFTITSATSAEAREFWDSRRRERFVPTFDSEASGILSFADIGFADWNRVGTKAANLAELTHFLGPNAPSAGLAIPFRYYEEFMTSSQTSTELCDEAGAACESEGRDAAACRRARELCAPAGEPETFSAHAARLLEDTAFNEETALRDAALAQLRHCIERTPLASELGQLLDASIFEVFGDAKVKLRSSTNTEDLPDFSGAGLYSSHGAYAKGDKAASRVLPKVFASVWSFRAFEERAFWNIDHAAVRMGCAINEAFVDELANGVLITQNIADPTTFGMYANVQKGEASVTNPENGELPEVFSILADTGYQVARSRYSSLSPNSPLLSPSEIQTLYDAGARAQAHFTKLYRRPIILDIEFKLTPDHHIVFKQARPYVHQ